MTPRNIGEMLGLLTGKILVAAFAWLVLVLGTFVVSKVLGKPLTLGGAIRSRWILWTVAALLLLMIGTALA
jgi:hypothetical protein